MPKFTPNMLNTYVPAFIKGTEFEQFAEKTAEIQSSGRMDEYMSDACSLAKSMGIKVCDCYGKWKELSRTQDTTKLPANGINHPKKEMHELFAEELYKCIFDE